jgi:hypothetical protein
VGVQVPFETGQTAGEGVHPIHFQIERLAADSAGEAVVLREKSTFMIPH